MQERGACVDGSIPMLAVVEELNLIDEIPVSAPPGCEGLPGAHLVRGVAVVAGALRPSSPVVAGPLRPSRPVAGALRPSRPAAKTAINCTGTGTAAAADARHPSSIWI